MMTVDKSNMSQEELLEKYDKESAYRKNLGPWGWITLVFGAALTLFQLYTGYRGSYPSIIQGSLHLGTALGLAYLFYPIHKNFTRKKGVAWYDALLAVCAMAANYYIVMNYTRLVTDASVFGFTSLDVVVATVGILLLLEATRRVVGLPIVIIALVAIAFFQFGYLIPVVGGAQSTWSNTVTKLFFSTSGVFGTPIQISSTYIYLFLFFGVMLVQTNIGQFFNDIAFRLTGRFTGGTAKTAVVASALQGMVNGSSVANTVGSGSFTIPMMKRAGFRPEFAAATEASASTGGQIMPPIMGAAAFIMAQYTDTPYSEIMLVAIIPAILYFSGVFMGTHFEAKRAGILGVSKDQLPKTKNLLKRLDLLIPLLLIIGLLLMGYTPTFAALWAIFGAFVISFFRKDTRLSLAQIVKVLETGARTALPVICACASAGIIVGTVTVTGLGPKIAGTVIDLSGGIFFFVLFFTMIACLILGMGLPTTANYVVTATMAAPALLHFGVPVIAVHMFVFYFGIVADITPPVCLAAYAGAGIARANPMKAGVNAVKLAIAAFIIPYMFVFNPQLVLQGATVGGLIIAIPTAIIGMCGVSAGMMGYFMKRAVWFERILLVGFGLMLIYPGHVTDAIGILGLIAIAVFQYMKEKSTKTEKQSVM
jgi:TRAP transporter 4TM/12TM fusion protein